ncbi:hypothetical protein Pcinc_013848 [Petrolisthes cinctipes]|uniref:Calcification-associated peptide-2 n=1 Tax=Petrolisthes cinctipes TaxID=88211 RepID=A0AAE1FXR4_PETCI|nr:hypothetical protein Pcinc_013848 [Petrolisthes cinctipes]
MKIAVVLLLGLVALVAARPESVLDMDLEDIHQDLDIDEDNVFHGEYRWTSPEGNEYFVKYVADEDGYRVLESNAVPITDGGVAANGAQGSFSSDSDEDYDDDDDDDDDFFD